LGLNAFYKTANVTNKVNKLPVTKT